MPNNWAVKEIMKISASSLEATLAGQMRVVGLPEMRREYKFHPQRKWRADFADEYARLIVEVDGGTWIRGAHSRGRGQRNDCEKRNAAQLLGWTVLVFTTDQIHDGTAVATVEEFYKQEVEKCTS